MIINSPIKLGKGGSAKFAKQVMNHQVVIKGRIVCNPRARSNVRL